MAGLGRRGAGTAVPTPAPGVLDAFALSIDVGRLTDEEFVRLIGTLDMLGRADAGVDLSALRTETFVLVIARASAAQLDLLMADDSLRSLVLTEVFRRMRTRLDVDRAADLRAVVHWRFSGGTGDGGFDRFQTVVRAGTCESSAVQDLDPRATITLAPADFLRMATGNASAPLLFIRGKVKIKGDIPFAAGFANYFDIPQPQL